MLWIGLRRSRRRDPLRLLVPASWLVIGLLFLVGFRIGLNVADSNVIDVGYAGVIGADRMADGARAVRRASRTTTSTATPTGR